MAKLEKNSWVMKELQEFLQLDEMPVRVEALIYRTSKVLTQWELK